MPKKGQIINLTITAISSDGRGIGKYEGQVVFVKEGVPGDIVDVLVTGKKKKLLEGTVNKIISPSPDRKEAFCQHFGVCGGCKWQHMEYQAQLLYKQNHVEENLKKISGIALPGISPILGSARTEFYRNKLEYTFSSHRWFTKEEISEDGVLIPTGLGFHVPKRFDKILNINKCYLQADPSNDIRVGLKQFADQNGIEFFDLKKQTGFLRNLIIRNSSTGDLMVILQVAYPDAELIEKCMAFLKDAFHQITSLHYVVNQKGNETFHDLEVKTYAGKGHIMEQMGDLTFKIGPKSFYQTNSQQAYELYKIVADFARLSGSELVYDLYTGTGTIANFVARSARQVIGIEYVADAIEDAKVNSDLNGITNTRFFAGDIKDMLANEFINQHGKPDVIITDPPRAGMHMRVTQLLADLKVSRMVYVSCNPATQARDMEVLGQSYDVMKIQPVDMFPHTQHVENVVLLELKK